MALQYEHHCDSCGGTFVSDHRIEETCPIGHRRVRRKFSAPAFHREYPGHFNHSVGQYVSNPRELRDALSKGSDVASEDTGIEHHYVMGDTRDPDLYDMPKRELVE